MTPSVASEEETHARRSPRPGKMLSPDVQTFFHRARAYSSNAAAKHVRWSTELGSSLLTRREVEQRLQRRTTESLQEMIALYRSSSRCSQTVLNPYAKISVPHSDLERESSVSQQDSMKDMIDDSSVSICSVQTPVDLIRSRERYQRYFTHLCTTIARRVRFQQRLLKLSNFRSAAGDKLSFPDSKDLQTRGGLARNVESTYCENDSIQDLNWTPIASSAIPVIRSDTENSFESFEIDTSTTDGKSRHLLHTTDAEKNLFVLDASENLSEPRMRHLNWDVRLHFYDIEPNRVPFDYHLREYPTFPFISHPFIVGGMPLQDLRPFLLDAEWKALSQAHGAMKENRRFGNEKQVTQRSARGVQNTNSENVKVGATSELRAFYMYEAQICQSNIEARKLKSSNNKALNFTFVDGNNWPRCSVAGVPGTVPVFTQPISFPLLPPGFQYPIDQISPIAPQTHVEALTVELQKERTLTGNENLSSSRLLLPFTNLKYNKYFYARGKIMRQPASDDIMSDDDEEEEEHDEVSDDVATVKVIGGTVHEEIGISGNSNGNSNEKKKYQGSIAHIRTLIAASQHPKNLLPLSLGLMGEDEQKRGMRNPPWFIPFEWTAEEEIPVRNFDLGFENECLRERIVQNKSSIEALTGSFHGAAKWVL